MKKYIAVLLSLVLLLSTTSVALAKPEQAAAKKKAITKTTKISAQNTTQTLAAKSTYEFAYKVPENIVTQQDAVVEMTFQTAQLGQQGYTGVHFEFAATNSVSGTAYFTAKDNANNSFTFTNSGTWGPQGGFALPARYRAVTNWAMKFTKAGQYNIVFKALDSANNVITEKAQLITVTDVAFVYTVPAAVYAARESTVKAALLTQQSYSNVHLEFARTTGPGDVTFKMLDSNTTYLFENAGVWNIGSITAPYNVATPWGLTFSLPGTYTINYKLVDNTSLVLAQSSKTIIVRDAAAIDDDEDEDKNRDKIIE